MKKSQKGFAPLLLLAVAALVIIGGGIAFEKMHSRFNNTASTNTNMSPTSATNSATPVTSQTQTNMATDTSIGAGTSNADLDNDLKTIGSKMNSVNSASTDVDTSIQNQSNDNQNIQ